VKVLLVSSSSGSRGGGELYLLYLGRALAERGIRQFSGHRSIRGWMNSPMVSQHLAESSGASTRIPMIGASVPSAPFLDTTAASRALKSWETIGADVIHLNKQNLEDGLDLLRALKATRHPKFVHDPLNTERSIFEGSVCQGTRRSITQRSAIVSRACWSPFSTIAERISLRSWETPPVFGWCRTAFPYLISRSGTPSAPQGVKNWELRKTNRSSSQ
jgi:hypothetical protein